MKDAIETPNTASGLAYFLSLRKAMYSVLDIDAMAESLEVKKKDLLKWISGQPVPEEHRAKIALYLNIPKWVMSADFHDDLLMDCTPRIPSNGIYVGPENRFSGYWGNIGLKAPGSRKSVWMSCSDKTYSVFMNGIVNDDHPAVLLPSMGLCSFLVFPDNMQGFSLVSEPGDHVEGDWEISSTDPVEGLGVGFLSLLDDYDLVSEDMGYCIEESLGKEMSKVFRDETEEVGGVSALYDALTTVEITFRDGHVETYRIDFMNKSLQENLNDFADLWGDDDYPVPRKLIFNRNDDLVVIPTAQVAMIRFPSNLLLP